MKRLILAAIAALAVAAPTLIPSIAQAHTLTQRVTRTVQAEFGKAIHNRGRLAGTPASHVRVRCARDTRTSWNCYGTYIIRRGRERAKFGDFIDAQLRGSGLAWHSSSDRLLRRWFV